MRDVDVHTSDTRVYFWVEFHYDWFTVVQPTSSVGFDQPPATPEEAATYFSLFSVPEVPFDNTARTWDELGQALDECESASGLTFDRRGWCAGSFDRSLDASEDVRFYFETMPEPSCEQAVVAVSPRPVLTLVHDADPGP